MAIIKTYTQIVMAAFFLFFGVNVFAQKTNMKNLKVSYTQLPLQPLDKNIKTYNSVLNMAVTMENTDLEKLKNQYLKLHGYEKTENDADVTINADFGEFKINKELITKEVYNVNQAENVTGYYYEISIEYPVEISLTGKNGNIIFEQAIEHDKNLLKDGFGKWTYSTSELDAKFNAEKDKLFTDLKNKCDKKALLEIKEILSSNFSYLDVTKKIKIASGKGRKLDYSDLESAVSIMEKAFDMISSKTASENVNSELNKAIIIWENALKESSSNNKARINEEITTMLYYNIGIAYWWMQDFVEARSYMDKALKCNSACSKPSSSDEKKINETINDINDYETRLKVHGKL